MSKYKIQILAVILVIVVIISGKMVFERHKDQIYRALDWLDAPILSINRENGRWYWYRPESYLREKINYSRNSQHPNVFKPAPKPAVKSIKPLSRSVVGHKSIRSHHGGHR